MLLLLHVVLVAAAARAPAAEAWGKDGHYMICKIADVSKAPKQLAAVATSWC